MRSAPFLLLTAVCACAQVSAPIGANPRLEADLQRALVGRWVGFLEYRDYSEPPTSPKRVQLPAWVEIAPAAHGFSVHYLYDDGPNKVVGETEQVTLDPAHDTYTSAEPGHAPVTYQVSGFDKLKDGRGTLVLTAPSTDDGKPSDARLTLTVRRNLVEWEQENRPVGSAEPFAFRHLLRLVRAEPPAASPSPR